MDFYNTTTTKRNYINEIVSNILMNDLNIYYLLEDEDNLFYLNNENEEVHIPNSIRTAFQKLYLQLKVVSFHLNFNFAF